MAVIDTEIALAAARRWQERTDARAACARRLAAGDIAAAETPSRIKARLDRLAGAAAVAAPARTGTLIGTIGVERVIGRPDFLGVAFLERGLAMSRFVGRVNLRDAAGRTLGFGTGFMVSPRLLLTNHHVLPDAEAARTSRIEFDYQQDGAGRLLPIVPFALLPDQFYLADQALDYALVAVAERSDDGAGIGAYGWSRLIGSEGKILLGESMNLIQHPGGQAKQIVLRANELVDLFGDFAHYVSDTEPGSSGSPVYNDQWEVVALHHSGVPRTADGRILRKDGKPWVDGDDPEQIDWIANEGIRVSSLVAHIQAQPLEARKAALRDEMLSLVPPDAVETALGAVSPKPSLPVQPVAVAVPKPEPSSSVTFTVPVTITVSVGAGVGIAVGTAAPPPASSTPAAPPPPEQSEALAALALAAGRTYYDEAADQTARDLYYSDIAAGLDGFGPAELFEALGTLLRTTHVTPLPYKPAVHVYPGIDLHDGPAPRLRSIYSGKTFDPAEFIAADFAVEAERARVAAVLAREVAGPAGAEALLLLEAQLPYNCEHVVPQSWFGKREPMRGDLHHLFACESGCNSFRGNHAYFDFADFEEALRSDCGKREEGRFEPASGKGAVARATLYFLLRYPGMIGDAARELPADRLALLLDWHRRHPVDLYERHRCAAIQAAQGNRNPLIDFPDWADRIDFTKGFAR
jgi:endonuclease I/V8-like Glu-specific endopeptidase